MSDAKAKEYSNAKVRLTIGNLIFLLTILLVLIGSGLSVHMRNWAMIVSDAPVWVVGIYYAMFAVFMYVCTLPISVYESFLLEHKYSLSNQSFGQWFWEDTKKQFLALGLGLLLVEGLYWLMRAVPEMWWLCAWVCWIAVSVILGKIFPVVIVPLFYKYTDIGNDALKERLVLFAQKYGLRVKDVYGLNLSKTTKKANACFCGMGKTKRIILSDTLLENFTHDEIEAVLAHEVGHCKRRHIIKNIGFSSVVSFGMFFLIAVIVTRVSVTRGFGGIADVAAFPLLFLVMFVFGIFLMPMQNAFSRRMENEADDFAFIHASVPEAFFLAMERLATLNLADTTPHPIIEFFLYSHPSIARRIARQKAGGK